MKSSIIVIHLDKLIIRIRFITVIAYTANIRHNFIFNYGRDRIFIFIVDVLSNIRIKLKALVRITHNLNQAKN